MPAEIIRPDFGARPREITDNPIFRAIDDLSRETENMRWLSEAGERARRLNAEAQEDGDLPPEAA